MVVPQLKNLTILDRWEHRYLISAPDLESLVYKGFFPLHLYKKGFHALEKADICVYEPHVAEAPGIVHMLEQLKSVKFLTLNLETVELLSSSIRVISNHPSPFANLKSLKIHPVDKLLKEEQKNTKMSNEVKNYLLGSSPRATLTIVSREDILATENTKLAQKLMGDLRVLLEQEKVKIETNKAPMGIKMPPQLGGTTAQIKSCWKDLSVKIDKRKDKAFLIISSLENIEKLVTKLPASNRAMIQPCFSSLFADVNVVLSKLTDCVKIHCDENQRRLSLCS